MKIIRHYKEYYPEKLDFKNAVLPETLEKGFVIKLRLKEIPDSRKTLFSVPGALEVYCDVYEKGVTELSSVQETEQYFVYAKEGKSPIIEIKLNLDYLHRPEWNEMTLGIPLNRFDIVNEDLYIFYDKVHLRFIYKNEIINENWPIGHFSECSGKIIVSDEFKGISYDEVSFEEKTKTYNKSFRYYSPFGYNEWVGDVTNFCHDGIYHFLFLDDRHNHGNRFGCGAHYFSHVTTKDFYEWHDYGAVYELNEQWQTMGTGNMHFKDGKYYLTHGWHTDRSMPKDMVGAVLQQKEFDEKGEISAVSFEKVKEAGLIPSGATYLYSDDGVNFIPSEKQIHISENPSMYTDKDGNMLLFAGYNAEGVWVSDSIDGVWKKHSMILPTHKYNPTRATTECPAYFEWNGYKYLIMGFVGFWQTDKNNDEFIDMAERGFDIYDGLNVPMVTNYGGRYIMSGWVRKKGQWAFVAAHRELIQEENGRLKLRWLNEFTPKKENLSKLDNNGKKIILGKGKSYYFEMDITPQNDGVFHLEFEGEGTPFELKLDSKEKRAQINYKGEDDILTMDEYIKTKGEDYKYFYQSYEKVHWFSHNFSIKNIEELDNPYTLKGILYYEEKENCNILDVEIAGKRTMISVRDDFVAESVTAVCENAFISKTEFFEMNE